MEFRLAERHAASSDQWIEAISMLYYLGAGSRVRAEWIEDLLAGQRPDGGRPRHPRVALSDPHPTALALWVRLEQLQPDADAIRWIAGRPS